MIVLKFSYHCYSEATRFSHAYIFSPRCKIPHSFENFYNFIYQTTLLSRISCDTISTQNRKLFSTFIVTRKIYSRSASLTGFLPSSLCFLMVSAASVQTCWTVTHNPIKAYSLSFYPDYDPSFHISELHCFYILYLFSINLKAGESEMHWKMADHVVHFACSDSCAKEVWTWAQFQVRTSVTKSSFPTMSATLTWSMDSSAKADRLSEKKTCRIWTPRPGSGTIRQSTNQRTDDV